ncbi:hypothetical protein [Actinomadura macrotermitis]|uniref:Uncharacterized protein n=1 Tax=Actinomadura macrotermitis TaxID=2585200 RepID=A0A7K0C3G8_9ACTN|nr:hypothetical protein [Actinomadura macrotermitis]MQY07632.1 hypothetical protein [Actinomadura macrotermitis]
MPAVTFRDETPSGKPLAEFQVADLPAAMTVRELIRLRVREEVARANAHRLVQPDPHRVDWERQADLAERAFEGNGFFMLVGDRQAESLDETVDLTTDPELVFIKLIALAGG